MIKTAITNIRSKVDKRQIVQYLILRQRILHQKIMQPTKGEDIRTLKKRNSEILKIINLIRNDTIDNELKKMHQYIHRQNDYLRELKELPKEVIDGLMSALKDIENKDYIILSNDKSSNSEIEKLTNRLMSIDNIEKSNKKMSNLEFEKRKEKMRFSLKMQIELKKSSIAGYNKVFKNNIVIPLGSKVDHSNLTVKEKHYFSSIDSEIEKIPDTKSKRKVLLSLLTKYNKLFEEKSNRTTGIKIINVEKVDDKMIKKIIDKEIDN